MKCRRKKGVAVYDYYFGTHKENCKRKKYSVEVPENKIFTKVKNVYKIEIDNPDGNAMVGTLLRFPSSSGGLDQCHLPMGCMKASPSSQKKNHISEIQLYPTYH